MDTAQPTAQPEAAASASTASPPAQPTEPVERKLGTGLDRTVLLASGAPSATLTAADTAFPFAQPVKSVLVQNNTAATLYANLDQAASPGTLAIAAGQTLIVDYPCQILHLYSAASANVNGSLQGAIFVQGAI